MKSKIQKTKLKEVCKIEKGKIGITKAVEGEYPLIVTAKERLSHNEWHFNEPATIVPLVSSTGHGHASIKRLHYAEGKYAVGNILATLIPKDHDYLNAKYLYVYLTIKKEELLVSQMTGAANVTLTLTRLADVEIEIPDYTTQLKVVKRYEDSENYKNQMESQIGLRSQLIENLYQQILQDAITGKLSEKWRKENSNIESAGVLLEKTKSEKEKLIKEGKIRMQKALSPISKEEIPFEVPEGWVWCRLGKLGESNIGLTYSPSDISAVGTKVIRSNNIQGGKLILKNLVHVSIKVNDSKILKVNDIVLCSRNGSSDLVGKAALVNKDSFSFGAFMTCFRTKFYSYVYYFFQSDYYRSQLDDKKSTGISQLTQGVLTNLLFPLPPLAEQYHIVEHIESLLTKLDRIKELNIDSKNNIDLLSQVVLKGMFEE